MPQIRSLCPRVAQVIDTRLSAACIRVPGALPPGRAQRNADTTVDAS